MKTDITASYMGLSLSSPVIAASSDFTSTTPNILRLAKAGAGAVVLKSVFEEQILMEIDAQRTNNMFNSYAGVEDYIAFYTRSQAVRDYLDLISEAREKAGIPVIASIHCSGIDTWVEFARDIQDAGADALELNIFILPSDIRETDAEVLQRYHAIIDAVKQHTHLPIALKLHHYFTGMANTLSMLAERSEALVLFNRFFNPEINIDTLSIGSSGSFSTPDENGLVQRWIGILRPHLQSSLAATTGIHDGPAVVRNLLAGANVVQVASAIYSNGPEVITQMNHFLKEWMERSGNSRLDDFIGKLSYSGIPNPALYERAQFMKYFSGLNR